MKDGEDYRNILLCNDQDVSHYSKSDYTELPKQKLVKGRLYHVTIPKKPLKRQSDNFDKMATKTMYMSPEKRNKQNA